MSSRSKSVVVTAACLMFAAGATQAQESTILKVASFLPATHHIIEHGTQVWMDSVKTAVGDQVEIEFYPAGQAGKAAQLLDIMQAGAIDVIGIPLGYYTDRFPLFGVAELPGIYDDPCKAAGAMRSLATPGGLFHEGDVAPQNLHPLAYYLFSPYSVMSRDPIHSVEDFVGKKIRTAGGAMELEVTELGGVAVKMSSPEILQSLARGTIDGAMLTYLSGKQYDLQTAAKFGTKGYSFGGATIILAMTESRYQELPDELKVAVDAAGLEAEQAYCSFAVEGDAAAAAFMEEAGMEMHQITAEERAAFDTKLEALATNWSGQLDQIGKPGTEVLTVFRQALAE